MEKLEHTLASTWENGTRFEILSFCLSAGASEAIFVLGLTELSHSNSAPRAQLWRFSCHEVTASTPGFQPGGWQNYLGSLKNKNTVPVSPFLGPLYKPAYSRIQRRILESLFKSSHLTHPPFWWPESATRESLVSTIVSQHSSRLNIRKSG